MSNVLIWFFCSSSVNVLVNVNVLCAFLFIQIEAKIGRAVIPSPAGFPWNSLYLLSLRASKRQKTYYSRSHSKLITSNTILYIIEKDPLSFRELDDERRLTTKKRKYKQNLEPAPHSSHSIIDHWNILLPFIH